MPTLADLDTVHKTYSTIYVDAMNLVSRNFHGQAALSWNGAKTGMLYGTVRAVLSFWHRFPGAEVVFLWEGRNPGRKKVFPLYKAARARSPMMDKPDFVESLEMTREALKLMGIRSVSHEGLEADDIADNLSAKATDNVLLASGDWDWWQFVSSKVDIFYDNMPRTRDRIERELCFPPERFYLYKALCGDVSDGLPPVSRFPKKLAQAICCRTDDHDKVVDVLMDMHQNTWAAKLKGQMWLVKRNIMVLMYGRDNFSEKKLVWEQQPMDKAALKAHFEKWGCKKFIEDMAL